jgi:hypothetical protein
MFEFILRVKIENTWVDMPFRASSAHNAIKICETQFGRGSYMGLIESTPL